VDLGEINITKEKVKVKKCDAKMQFMR